MITRVVYSDAYFDKNPKEGRIDKMDLGVLATDVISNAELVLTGFGVIFALCIGVALAVGIIRVFVRTR